MDKFFSRIGKSKFLVDAGSFFGFVINFSKSTCFHTHMLVPSAWVHVGGVHKNPYPTRKQAKKNNAKPKNVPVHKQSCGTAKTESLT